MTDDFRLVFYYDASYIVFVASIAALKNNFFLDAFEPVIQVFLVRTFEWGQILNESVVDDGLEAILQKTFADIRADEPRPASDNDIFAHQKSDPKCFGP